HLGVERRSAPRVVSLSPDRHQPRAARRLAHRRTHRRSALRRHRHRGGLICRRRNSSNRFCPDSFSAFASLRLGESNFFCLNPTVDAPPPQTRLERQLPTKITAKKGDRNVSRQDRQDRQGQKAEFRNFVSGFCLAILAILARAIFFKKKPVY